MQRRYKYVQLEEAITSGNFNRVDNAINLLTEESIFGYFKDILNKLTNVLKYSYKDKNQRLVYPKGILGNVKKASKKLDNLHYMDIINTGVIIERGFKGNRLRFIKDISSTSKDSFERFDSAYSALELFLKTINRDNGISNNVDIIIPYKATDFSKWFTGEDEVDKIGNLFGNIREIQTYMTTSVNMDASVINEQMLQIRNKIESLNDLLETVAPVMENADNKTVQFIIGSVENLARLARENGAANASIITNVGTVTNLVAVINALT